MRNKFVLTIFMLFFIIGIISLSSAYIVPSSHGAISHAGISKALNSRYGQIASEHFDDFSACNSLTDYSVFFYFQQGFSTIGKVYLASHSTSLCARALELADKSDDSQIACALGICSMDAEDVSSHNGFVPMMIQRVGLPNGILHAPSEECVDKLVSTPQLQSEGISALVNKYPVHKAYLIKVFQSDERASSVDVSSLMDAFVAEVSGNQGQYTVGFRGFTAIPLSIHLILLLIFLACVLLMTLLIKKKNKGLFNKISIVILLLVILFVILLYVLYFTGNIWKAFQIASTPYCWIAPMSGWETYYNQAIANEANLLNNGASALLTMQDPAGLQSLHSADQSTIWKLWVIGIVLVAFIALFIWLNFRKKKS